MRIYLTLDACLQGEVRPLGLYDHTSIYSGVREQLRWAEAQLCLGYAR